MLHKPTLIDWAFLLVFLLWTAMFLHLAWENLVRNRVSKFSIDRLGIYIEQRLGGKRAQARIQQATHARWRFVAAGLLALGWAAASVYFLVIWLAGL